MKNSFTEKIENFRIYAYDIIRIFLGFALFIRGILLAVDPAKLTELAGSEQYFWVYSYVSIGHIVGGILVAIGFLTRLGAIVQLPILFGAVFVIHLKQGLLHSGQSLEISVLVLFLLIIIAFFGGNRMSLDRYWQSRKQR